MSTTKPPTYILGYQDEASVSKLTYRPLGNTDMVVSSLR